MAEPGALVADAFAAAAARAGLPLHPGLRLLRWRRGGAGSLPELNGPHDLGPLHEAAVAGAERARRGAWYTPRWLADDLVARAFAVADRTDLVADPACGGGVFLLAAAERLVEDRSPSEVVASLWGCDVDPVAAAVTEAALWWWSAERGDPAIAGARVEVGDALTAVALPAVDVVVGNPPFLGQLRTDTATSPDRREALRDRFGPALGPYTDEAWLFLLRSVSAVRDGGSVVLVQPTSVLGARDAGPVRHAVDARAELRDCWIDTGRAFDAAVQACAPVLHVGRNGVNDWSGGLAEAAGVPDVVLHGEPLEQLATVVAGFRDEYYGLVDAVDEGGSGRPLVTAGAIDPLRRRPDSVVRFAKRRWQDPRVDPSRVGGRAGSWLASQHGPKLLVATQTRVVEALVDQTGDLVGSVPIIVVRPHDPSHLWHLAVALHAPVVSAWMVRRAAGTALSNDACKPTAHLVSTLPLPVDATAWDRAAELARTVAAGADRWEELGAAADLAYGVTDARARDWWLERLPLR